MTRACCGLCGRTFEGDVSHVRVLADIMHFDDKNEKEGWEFHPDCWRDVTEDWIEPA
jgi:hypothetical protein